MLDNLKARVSLTDLVTRNARCLLVAPVVTLAALLFSILAFAIDTTVAKGYTVLEAVLMTGLLQIPMLVIPLFVSTRVSILKNIVAAASLRKIIDYLEHIPDGWMLTQRTSLNISSLFSVAGLMTIFVALVTLWVNTQKQTFATPWDNRYRDFGSCLDGIRSGLEQHIDCGGPESSCSQTCREKYGDYIIIPATRDCTDVEGYVHITTQRSCSIAYKATGNNNSLATHALVMEGVLEDGISGFQPNTWHHADWTHGFRCGAVTRPGWAGLTATTQKNPFTSFPALFSPWNPSFGTQQPLAYLCYADRPQSCQAHTQRRNKARFKETMACSSAVRRDWLGSAWRNISSTRPIPSTKFAPGSSVAEFRAGRGSNGDCAEIQLHAVQGIGSHVVFALECNVSAYNEATSGAEPGDVSGNDRSGIACPEDNRVTVSLESAAVPRAALVVYPAANAKNMTSYTLEKKQQTVVVSPDSTLMLVVDKNSGSMSVSLCF